jgi:hypothetical protein
MLAFTALALPAIAETNLIVNGSFEQGDTGWSAFGDFGFGPGST